ncbi:MAG: cation:proton antiporter [Methanosarcinales archaeon]
MISNASLPELLQIGIAFFAISLSGIFANKFKQSVIPAYIIGGLIIGPYGFKLVEDLIFIEYIGIIGVIFLLLFMGLEFSVGRLITAGKSITRAGIIDLVINFPLGFLIGYLFKWNLLESLFLAGIVYISSSAIIAKALVDFKRIANPETETILGILIFEDIFIAFYLAVISGIAYEEGTSFFKVSESIIKALTFCIVLLIIARKFSGAVSKMLEVRSEELFIIHIFSLVIIVSASAYFLGISEAIGAFLIGLVFAETEHHQRIKEKVLPLRDLFASMFFFAFGMSIDITAFKDTLVLIAIAIPLSILGKIISGFVAANINGLSNRAAISTGCGTVARGEFSIILSEIGAKANLINILQPFTAVYVLILAILGPVLMKESENIYKTLSKIINYINSLFRKLRNLQGFFQRFANK